MSTDSRNFRRVYQRGTTFDAVCVKVHRLPSTAEYRVRLYLKGSRQPAADYFTDNLFDARQTARRMYDNLTAKG